ncbi:Heme oxygenase [Plasmopara halstedii]|uniref:Heme oxygenase n=1 Tax=Plasmopara halstedii TaxID=4781 RepID=A0A0P1AVW6_PLAHL|nr:Heme oxygenase [Plasmopara halstedii]CEG45367.1 Heme oxygenase [Plasmopara halstedii]|eukprot:XP_024581736.1 Heme oxygenase [Plasmopara halstedii]
MLFYFVYVQLEAVIRKHKDHEAFCGLNDILSKIARADGIAKDLRFYLGEDWNFTYQPTQAVHDYIKHLKELEEKNPVLVLPYCYHMYMAMLAGGMMIKKLVKRSFALPEGEGLDCFAFDVKSNKALRDTVKEEINKWQPDEETRKAILAESVNCFRLNNQIVRSLDGAGVRAVEFILKWSITIGCILLMVLALLSTFNSL